MVIMIIGGTGEGKSGSAHWLRAQLKKVGINATLDDGDINEEQYNLISKNYDKVMASIAKKKIQVNIVTKQKNRSATDQDIIKARLEPYKNAVK